MGCGISNLGTAQRCLAWGSGLAIAVILAVPCFSDGPPREEPVDEVELRVVGRFESGLFDVGASEIAGYHPGAKRLFVVNGSQGLDMLDASDVGDLRRVAVRRLRDPTSVAIFGDLVAVAARGASPTARGMVHLLDPTGTELARLEVGHAPDMVAFTPDGRTLLVACEGEASPTDATIDPPGSIALIDLANGPSRATVTDAGFDAFEAQRSELMARGLRAVVPGRTLSQEIEPEFIATSPDGRWAFATLQENNAIAVLDLEAQRVTSIQPLGFRDGMSPGMGFDAIDDDKAAPRAVPVSALFQPDAIVAFEQDGELWLVTANEGEAREGVFDEAITLEQARALARDERARGHGSARGAAPSEAVHDGEASALSEALLPEGRLLVSCVRAPASAGAGFCTFGTRSVSLWRVDRAALEAGLPAISLAWDSGEAIERLVSERTPALFNADHRRNARIDARSLIKGPEPEGLAIGAIDGHRLLFVTLERCGGVVVIDASVPLSPRIVGFSNTRHAEVDLSIDLDRDGIPDELAQAGDLGPEGVHFIPAAMSPTGRDLLVVCHEVSGTTTLLEVTRR